MCASGARARKRGDRSARAKQYRISSAAIRPTLDEAGVARAAIESLAENFSDGVVAPVFWMVHRRASGRRRLQGDQHRRQHDRPSHRSVTQDFGWAAARLDDLVNLPASRLSALLIVAAACFDSPTRGRRARSAAVLRDVPATRLAQCRLSGGGDGRRARACPRRPALLWRRPSRGRCVDGRWALRAPPPPISAPRSCSIGAPTRS